MVYSQWTYKSDPEPMILALETALARHGRQAPLLHPEPAATGREALQALTVLEALEKARKVLKEIGTTGGDYGHIDYAHGNLVYDATQAEAALRYAAAKIGGSQ